jgi:hypothetical protein
MPPPRSDVALTDEERKRLKDELIATRARTEANNPAPSLSGPAPAAGATPKP